MSEVIKNVSSEIKPKYGGKITSVKYAGTNPAYMKATIKYSEAIVGEAEENADEAVNSDRTGMNPSDGMNMPLKGSVRNIKGNGKRKSISLPGGQDSGLKRTTKTVFKMISGFIAVPMAAVVMGTVFLLIIYSLHTGHEKRVHTMILGEGFPETVEAWRSFAMERLIRYNEDNPDIDLPDYINVILTTIWQESDGNPDGPGVGGDIMQSRESGYWEYSIPDDWEGLSRPEKSIDAGVRFFTDCLRCWHVEGPNDTDNLQMVMQGYNYGVAFLEYAKARGAAKWSEELSQSYCNRMGGHYGTVTYAERWLSKYQTAVGGGSWVWPMPACHDISSRFGARWGTTHRGIDIPCPIGSEVIAANSGTVYYVGDYGTGGRAVIIDCGNGIMNYYYHLSRYAVSQGETVRSGQVIAYSGNTGNSTGPHLHFGVTVDGEYVDPEIYLK